MSQAGKFSSLNSPMETLTPDIGGIVLPIGGNIDLVGGTNITTTGTPGTVTIDLVATIAVSLGGTGATTLTDHGIVLGSGTAAVSVTAVGATNEILIGNTGADPSWSSSPTVTTLNATTVNATTVNGTTFDTNIAAAGLTLSGTTLSADGTDADIDINITAKGTGQVIIDDLQLTTDLAVTEGGTGVSTLTDHGVLVGSGAAAITALAVGTTNTVLLGATGADPTWGTVPNAALTNSSITLSNGNNITVTGSPVSLGGTATIAVSGTTQYALQVGDATGSLDSLGIGTANQILQSGGAGANPAWSTSTYPATTLQGDVLYASSDNVVASLAKDATATRYLANTGTSNNPKWDQVDLSNGVTGTLPVGSGGTGQTSLTQYAVLLGNATSGINTVSGVGTAGYVLTSNGAGADPTWQIASGVNTTFHTDGGDATESSDAITIAGGTNITTSGATATVTINLDAAISGMTSITMADTGALRTTTVTTDTMTLQAYDVDGTAYKDFITFTNGDTPTCDLDTDVTINSSYIYRAGGTDIPVADGGTGASTLTDHGILVGSDAAAITALAVGSTGEILTGSTGADPAWSATPSVTSLTATTVYGTTFDTNVAAAAVTLSGTTLSADGTDSDISINITAKGTGQVIIDDLQLTTDLAVTEGGTGASTLTDGGILLGSGTGAITATSQPTDGQLLIGHTGADPDLGTITEGTNIDVTNGSGSISIETTKVEINAQTGTTYQFVLGDAGKLVTLTNASAITLTVPANSSVAFATGTVITIAQGGAGTVTVTPAGGVTINSLSSYTDLSGQYAGAALHKTGTDTWLLIGSLA